jgi:hypothetical protein
MASRVQSAARDEFLSALTNSGCRSNVAHVTWYGCPGRDSRPLRSARRPGRFIYVERLEVAASRSYKIGTMAAGVAPTANNYNCSFAASTSKHSIASAGVIAAASA